MRPINNAKGFTLIEIVIAVTLLSLITMVTYGALQQIIRAKTLLDDTRDASAISNSIIVRLTRELQLAVDNRSLLPPPSSANQAQPAGTPSAVSQPAFRGEQSNIDGRSADRLQFVALEGGQYLPDGQRHSGMVQITYRVERDPENRDAEAPFWLVRDETPYLKPLDKAYERTMTFPVAKNVVSFAARYFDGKDEKWVAKWGDDISKRLPAMVKFTLALRSPKGKIETFSTALAIRAEG